MASKAEQPEYRRAGTNLRLDLLLRPMPPRLFLLCAAATLVLGALYCTGYEKLLTDRDNWPGSLVWAAYGLLPWLFLFEYVKRREWDADRALPAGKLAMLILATWALSVAAEYAHHGLLVGREGINWALPVLRRTPGIGALILLIALSRREQDRARRRSGPAAPDENDAEALRRYAPAIRFIQAADNYLELHGDGQVLTRRITMRAAEQVLQPLGFVRVHRSVMVNRKHVEQVVPRSGGPLIKLADGTALPTGRAFNANLRHLQ